MEGKSKESKSPSKQWSAFLAGLFLLLYFYFPYTPSPILPSPPQSRLPLTSLVIPKIQVSAPVIFSSSTEESTIQNHLRSGVVHLPQSALPGEVGNCYIVGHSSDYLISTGDYKTVFERLPQLRKDDLVTIESGAKTLNYKVLQTKVVAPNDMSALSQDTQGKRLLTLQTSYPIGTAQKRFLVVAVQVEK